MLLISSDHPTWPIIQFLWDETAEKKTDFHNLEQVVHQKMSKCCNHCDHSIINQQLVVKRQAYINRVSDLSISFFGILNLLYILE